MAQKPSVDMSKVFKLLRLRPQPAEYAAPIQRDWDAEIEAIEVAPAPKTWESPPPIRTQGQSKLVGLDDFS